MKKKLLIYSFLSVLAVTLTSGLLLPSKILAAISGNWVNIATLEVDGKRYQEDKIDNNWHFYLVDDKDGCTDEIDQLSYNPDAQNEGPYALPKDREVRLQVKEKSASGCNVTRTETVNLSNLEGAKYSFNWVDKGAIEIPGQGTQFKKDAALGGVFVKSGDNECKDTIEAGEGASSASLIVRVTRKSADTADVDRRNDLRSVYQGHSWVDRIDYDKEEGQGACIISDRIDGLPIGLVDENSHKEAGTGTGSGGGDGGGADTKPSCESNGGKMSWLLCPVLEYAGEFLQKVDEQLNHLLQVPNNYFECPKDTECKGVEQLKSSWARLRNIAYIFLVPMVLVMAIGTALGFELVSAYTVKKALPRLAIALIFMTLSYEITRFFIVVANDVGKGVLGLMTSAFSGEKEITLAQLFDPGGGEGFSFTVIILAGGALALGALGIILSYVFVAALVIFAAFLLLALRQMLLIALIVIAPLAILVWIFPGNDKFWKIWRETFTGLLLLYPLVMLLIGAGRAFAFLVSSTGESGLLRTLLILTAYIGPYFFIPAAFKFAGGVFANFSGMVNDKSRGVFDRQKKYRQRKYGEKGRDIKAGDYYKHGPGRSFNRNLAGLAVGPKGNFGLGRKGRQATAFNARAAAAQAAKENPKLQDLMATNDEAGAIMGLGGSSAAGARAAHDELLAAQLQQRMAQNQAAVQNGTMTQAEADTNYADYETAARGRFARGLAAASAVGFSNTNQRAALNSLGKARAIVGPDGGDMLRRGVARLAGSNQDDQADTLATVRYTMRQAGRADLGAATTEEGISRVGVSQLLEGPRAGVEMVTADLTNRFNIAVAGGNQADAIAVATEMAGIRNGIGTRTPAESRQVVAQMFQDTGLDIGAQESIDEQLGRIIAGQAPTTAAVPGGQGTSAAAQRITNEIRARAGLWDSGARGGGVNPAIIGQGQQQPPQPPPQPPQP